MFENAAYWDEFSVLAAVLVLKISIVHILQIRARFIRSDYKTPEDSAGLMRILGPIFKVLLLAFGPFGSKDFTFRLDGVCQNSAENEPFFLALAYAWGAFCTVPDFAVLILKVYWIARVVHALAYLFVRVQPFRAVGFLTGLGLQIFVAVQVVLAKDITLPNFGEIVGKQEL
eukprot:m.57062 g.57062  ORF g.57062 m.57062 type:complete len:172 (-) comp12693_c0_seq1:35-550(-)